MFPVSKLVRSIVGSSANPFLHSHNHLLDPFDDEDGTDSDSYRGSEASNLKTPLMIFIPTMELVKDTCRLARLAREIGLDLYPNPSLSHIIFSWPSSSLASSTPSPFSCSSTSISSSSSWSSASSWSLPKGAVPLPFPSLSTASLSHLRLFVSLSKGFFKLVFLKSKHNEVERMSILDNNNWDCSSLSLVSRLTGDRIGSMDSFCRALLGSGWTLYMTKNNPCRELDHGPSWGRNAAVYLFRRMEPYRLCAGRSDGNGNRDGGSTISSECRRVRELRLPPLDFRNTPLRILQYILLMTDDIFYLG